MRIAVLFNNRVQSVIVADSVEIAEEITGQSCVESNDANIGWVWNEEYEKFLPDQPYQSWTWNSELIKWDAPVEKPEGDFDWDELSSNWVERVADTQ